MPQPTSPSPDPLITRVWKLYNITDKFAELKYQSVFDVVRIPREQFIRQHRADLGRDVGKVYDLAVGYAQQVAHSFRRKRISREDGQTLLGPFSQPGPDYSSQFGDKWQAMCPDGAIEADDSPVAYLTAIYNEALSQEKTGEEGSMITLAERRPDIKDLLIDDAAVNQTVPQLQLVNEILSSAIQSKMKSSATEVNVQLASTRYPNNLPYHFAHQQVILASRQCKTPLLELLSATQPLAQDDANRLDQVLRLASELAPEQMKIIGEAAAFPAKNDSEAKTAWYIKNYGKDISAITVAATAQLQPLLNQTGLSVPQVEQLICRQSGKSNDDGNYSIIVSKNIKSQPSCTNKDYGAVFLHAGAVPNLQLQNDSNQVLWLYGLTDDRLDRLNRIVRLQKWLNLPYDQVDLLITSAMKAEGGSNKTTMNDNTLRMLGVFRHYQQTYGICAEQFAAWLHEVTPFAITPNKPFLDQVFNANGAFDTPFVVDDKNFEYKLTTGADGARVQHISAALGLNHRQFLLLADKIARQQGDVTLGTLDCKLSVVSAFYRLATLARTFGMSPEDLCALLDRLDNGTGKVWGQLAGQPAIKPLPGNDAILDDILTLLQMLSVFAQWQQQHQLSMPIVQLLLTPPTITNLPTEGNYGVTSSENQIQYLSIGWKDLTYDSNGGNLELTQQIAFRIDPNAAYFQISEFHYPLPDGLSLNGNMTWLGEVPQGATFNKGYGTPPTGQNNPDYPFLWPGTWLHLTGGQTYTFNIPLKGTFKNLSQLNALRSTVKIHTSRYYTDLNFSQGEILAGDIGFTPQGTTDQFNFIQQVWQNLPSTFVDAALLNRSGVPLVDNNKKAYDWLGLLKEINSKVIDADGLVTDVDIQGAVMSVVDSQSFSNQKDKDNATKALINTLLQAQQTQHGIATSLLAQSLQVNQSLPALLLRWTGQSVYRWLSTTWALKTGQIKTATDIPTSYLRQLREVARRALLTTQFSLSPALVQAQLDYPDYFGFTQANTTCIDLQKLYLFSRYSDLLTQVGAAKGGTEDDVLAYFQAVHAPSPDTAKAATQLAALLGWDAGEVATAAKAINPDTPLIQTLPQIDTVLRLQALSARTGLTVAQLGQLNQLSQDADYTVWQTAGQAMVAGVSHLGTQT